MRYKQIKITDYFRVVRDQELGIIGQESRQNEDNDDEELRNVDIQPISQSQNSDALEDVGGARIKQ